MANNFDDVASNFDDAQGAILMDGVDLLTLGLKEVRSRIAAIPQVRPRLGRAYMYICVMARLHAAMPLAILGVCLLLSCRLAKAHGGAVSSVALAHGTHLQACRS